MPAGLFSAIVFLQPVLLGIFSWIWLEESMYGLKIFGLVLGFIGVGVISSSSLTGHISVIGILLALGMRYWLALGQYSLKDWAPCECHLDGNNSASYRWSLFNRIWLRI